MKKLFCVMAVAAVAATVLYAVPAQGAAVVNNETWTEAQSPIYVKEDIVVQGLRIEEGVEVRVRAGFGITVSGKMVVAGSEDKPVVITCAGVARAGCWKGIKFADSQEGSSFNNVEIAYAEVGVNTNKRSWRISESWLHGNSVGADIGGAPLGGDTTGDFSENYINDNGTGVRVVGAMKDFGYNTITENKTGVAFQTIQGSYSDNNIFGNETLNATSCDFVGTNEINATSNWWGTVDTVDIEDSICDGTDIDKTTSPTIDFGAFETAPVAGAASHEEPAPEPEPTVSHARAVTLVLRRHLKAKGVASVTDGFAACMPASVLIQKLSKGFWKTIKTATVDSATGAYKTMLRDKPGKYQAILTETTTGTDACLPATSPTARHRH